MDEQIRNADAKFDMEETSDELLDTWSAEEEQQRNEREYYRDRLASETGIDVLDGSDIENQFDETLQDLYDAVFQRYHLDVCYEISDFQIPNEGTCFTVTSPVLEDGSLRVDVFANYIIDDDLGVDSVCKIECRDGEGKTICSAEISFRNGNGHEGEEGLMEADEDSEYDTSELEELREELFEYIDDKLITHGQQISLAASVGNLVSLSMRSFCQLVVAVIAVGTMNWRSVIDVANWWM